MLLAELAALGVTSPMIVKALSNAATILTFSCMSICSEARLGACTCRTVGSDLFDLGSTMGSGSVWVSPVFLDWWYLVQTSWGVVHAQAPWHFCPSFGAVWRPQREQCLTLESSLSRGSRDVERSRSPGLPPRLLPRLRLASKAAMIVAVWISMACWNDLPIEDTSSPRPEILVA